VFEAFTDFEFKSIKLKLLFRELLKEGIDLSDSSVEQILKTSIFSIQSILLLLKLFFGNTLIRDKLSIICLSLVIKTYSLKSESNIY
jgi:hypothetical protein